MQRLKRVFNIDIEACEHCGGQVKVTVLAHPCAHGISASLHVIASIDKSAGEPICTTEVARRVGHRGVTNEYPKVIEQILKHLKAAKANAVKQHELPPEREPPLTPNLFDPSQSRLFD